MLVRRPRDGSEIAIHQEQHALISGMLAAAWRPALHPRLIAAITWHDTPWREVDAVPRHANGRLVDFIDFPLSERLVFYATGITALEPVDPYLAYMVSLHYASFAGIAKMEDFRSEEKQRRDRLEPLLGSLADDTAEHLKWLQFFDVLSLHVCLTGPDVPDENLPIWLRDTARWSTAPDGRDLELQWEDPRTLKVSPWPFAGEVLELAVVVTEDGTPRNVVVELRP